LNRIGFQVQRLYPRVWRIFWSIIALYGLSLVCRLVLNEQNVLPFYDPVTTKARYGDVFSQSFHLLVSEPNPLIHFYYNLLTYAASLIGLWGILVANFCGFIHFETARTRIVLFVVAALLSVLFFLLQLRALLQFQYFEFGLLGLVETLGGGLLLFCLFCILVAAVRGTALSVEDFLRRGWLFVLFALVIALLSDPLRWFPTLGIGRLINAPLQTIAQIYEIFLYMAFMTVGVIALKKGRFSFRSIGIIAWAVLFSFVISFLDSVTLTESIAANRLAQTALAILVEMANASIVLFASLCIFDEMSIRETKT